MAAAKLIPVRVPADVARCLATLAETTDRSTSYVAAQAIEKFLTLQEWQVKAIRRGLADAEAEKLLDHREAVIRLKKWGRRGA